MSDGNINYIKQKVRELNESGVRLFFEWNAGGDETPVWAVAEPPAELDDHAIDQIRYAIISELRLPNAGGESHIGRGEIIFTSEDALAICHSSRLSYDGSDDYIPPVILEKMLELKDRGNLRRFLRRGNVRIYLSQEFNEQPKLGINFAAEEGDGPKLNAEQEAYYYSKLLPILEPYVAEFRQTKEGKSAGTVTVACNINQEEKVQVEIFRDFRYEKNYSSEIVILFR